MEQAGSVLEHEEVLEYTDSLTLIIDNVVDVIPFHNLSSKPATEADPLLWAVNISSTL